MNDDEITKLRLRVIELERKAIEHDRMFALMSDVGEVRVEGGKGIGRGVSAIVFDALCAEDGSLGECQPSAVREACERGSFAKAFLPTMLAEAEAIRTRKMTEHAATAMGIARAVASVLAAAKRSVGTGEVCRSEANPRSASWWMPTGSGSPGREISPSEEAMIETLDRETE